jgi:hypothetical protein
MLMVLAFIAKNLHSLVIILSCVEHAAIAGNPGTACLQRTPLPDPFEVDARDKIDIRLTQDEAAGRVGLARVGGAALLILAEKLTLLNRPASQLQLVRTRWQEFSVSAVTLSLNPRRHALARSKNVVITSESARRTREGSAFRSKFSAAHLGESCLFWCPPLLHAPVRGPDLS